MLFGFSGFDVVLFVGIVWLLLLVLSEGFRRRERRSSGFTDSGSGDGGWSFFDFGWGGGSDCGDAGGDCGGGDGGGCGGGGD